MSKLKFNLSVMLLLANISLLGQQLKPGDGIRITFFNIEDSVKGNYYVQDNGMIHLPYLGLVNTREVNFSELRSNIISDYSEIYRNPEINIQPLLRINIFGEVQNPGVYYLTGFETLTDLITIAGGETSDSNIENISIIRNESKLNVDLNLFLNGKNILSNIGIESGDKIYVPRRWWVGARDASIVVSGVAVLVALAGLFTN